MIRGTESTRPAGEGRAIQRISQEDAVYLARKAYRAGIRFFDTARAYTDSEVKLGEAFDGIRTERSPPCHPADSSSSCSS